MYPIAILAGGLATRLRPLTDKTPKALLPIAGEPFIFHQLRLLKKNGFTHVILCVSHLGEQIKKEVEDGANFGLSVQYSFDGDRLLGTGGALYKAKDLLGDNFFVTYGDSYLLCPYHDIQLAYLNKQLPALMTVIENNNQWDKSNVILKDGEIICYEKDVHKPNMTHIDYGLSIISSKVLEEMEPDKYYDLSDIFHTLAARGVLNNYCVSDRFYEIGSAKGLSELSLYFSQGEHA